MLQGSEHSAREYHEKKPVLPPKKQRPQQSLKRKLEPPKPESVKATPKETKVVKVPVKTSGVHDNSSAPPRKPETKKQEEVKKPVPPPAPVEPPLQGGNYELNARMTKMVEVELRDIMIKVWHELPDNPSDEAEALVVDKLRNQAGDYLRNVLGLNITKRLLNVHNPLYVKVQFSGKPEKVHLGEFLKKYNFTAFKRIEKTVNMFAAQVKTINDFDRICSDADVRCGDIKVSVTPIYKFTKCPPNLVTSFYDQDEDASDATAEKTEQEENPDNITSSEKVIGKIENVPTKPKEEIKSENTTKDKIVNKPVENKTAMNKPAVNNTVYKTPIKLAAENTAVNKPTSEKAVSKPAAQNKTVINTTADVKHGTTTDKTFFNNAVGNKTAVVKKLLAIANESAAVNIPEAVNKTVAKPAAQNNEVKKPQVAPKTNDTGKQPAPSPAKTTDTGKKPAPSPANTTDTGKKPAPSPAKTTDTGKKPAPSPAITTVTGKKPASSPAITTDSGKKIAPSPAKTTVTGKKPSPSPAKTIVTGKKPAPSPAKTTGKTDKGDDYDELDDQDILALMSEGIVLDECSGSDEE